jgi:hypothetical protein
MKTLKAMLMGLTLVVVCGVAQAAPVSHNNPTKDEVMNTYLDAVVHGKVAGVEGVIDEDAQFSMKRGERSTQLSRDQVLDGLKSSENVDQDCKCTKTVLQDDTEMSVLKVEMKFNDFTRTDVITAQRAGNGWKITKVETSFS